MIEYIKGDVTKVVSQTRAKYPESVVFLVHGCNCMNNMGSGLARVIADTWPIAVRADNSTQKGNKDKLGNYTLATVDHSLVITNLYSQYRYGGGVHADYEAIESGLRKLVEEIGRQHTSVIYLVPEYLGCGLAGGDINIVRPILLDVFKDTHCYLFDL